MGQVTLEIAGRPYSLGCRDGEEAHLERLGRIVDARAQDAARAAGAMTENRQLLLAALLLADALTENSASGPPAPSAPVIDEGAIIAIERLAERIENLAETLEKQNASA